MAKKPKDNLTIKELQAYIKQLEDRVSMLSEDSSYGILNRKAIELDLPAYKKEIRFAIFLDVDYLHEFNSRFGHEEANRRIREALHMRSSDIVLAGRWYSGDEIVILIRDGESPEGFCNRLRDSFRSQGMSATIAFTPFTGKLDRDVARAKKEVDISKAARGVKR